MELAHTLSAGLARLVASGRVEVRENGSRLGALEGLQYEVRRQGETVLLHMWSSERTLVRRVRDVVSEEPGRLELAATRFGRTRPDRLVFVSAGAELPAGRLAREQFRERFTELLAQQFPDEKLISLTAAPDLKHSLSGSYARGVMAAGTSAWAVLGAAPREAAATYDAMLTFGLLWLDRARETARRKIVAGLRLFVPTGAARITAHRLQALAPSTTVDLYEYDVENWRARRVDPRDSGNLETWLVPRREGEAILAEARPAIERIRRLAPGTIEAAVIPGTREVAVRFRGLLFARWTREGMFYGAPARHGKGTPDGAQQPLTPERQADFARLDPRFLYAQVPALSDGDRSVMDLVGMTRGGRLAVVELKASEDLQLLMQAADYWLRVRWHHARGDFTRYGYFPGVTLDSRPPLLFLVAPAIRFHSATDILLRYLGSDIEICRVGVSETWRRGLKVVLRQS